MNKNSAVATIVAVLVIVLALGLIVLRNQRPGLGDFEVFYYDLNTQKVFTAKAEAIPPIDSGGGTYSYPDGEYGSGVRADIYSCGDLVKVKSGMTRAEVEAAGAFIALLTRYSSEQKELIERMRTTGDTQIPGASQVENPLISTADGTEWVPALSDAGRELTEKSTEMCGDERTRFVSP
ncbi:MAG: hypothetical protein AAGG38_13400 [Planctomycetota bacterium]